MSEAVEIRKGFIVDGLPSLGRKVEVLCQQGGHEFILAFLCTWSDDGWIVVGTRRRLEYEVLGWRAASKGKRR